MFRDEKEIIWVIFVIKLRDLLERKLNSFLLFYKFLAWLSEAESLSETAEAMVRATVKFFLFDQKNLMNFLFMFFVDCGRRRDWI